MLLALKVMLLEIEVMLLHAEVMLLHTEAMPLQTTGKEVDALAGGRGTGLFALDILVECLLDEGGILLRAVARGEEVLAVPAAWDDYRLVSHLHKTIFAQYSFCVIRLT